MTETTTNEVHKGALPFFILSLLEIQDEYGYSLAIKIRQQSQNILKAGEGTLYPALYKLETASVISSYWSKETVPPRKYYKLTEKGRQQLKEQHSVWLAFVEMMNNNLKLRKTS